MEHHRKIIQGKGDHGKEHTLTPCNQIKYTLDADAFDLFLDDFPKVMTIQRIQHHSSLRLVARLAVHHMGRFRHVQAFNKKPYRAAAKSVL